jgi:hypothetical protein
MNTSVKSETWMSVGSRMPSTAMDNPVESISHVSPIATMDRTACCRADPAAASAQATKAPPHHQSEPGRLLDQRGGNGGRDQAEGEHAAAARKYLRSCSQRSRSRSARGPSTT